MAFTLRSNGATGLPNGTLELYLQLITFNVEKIEDFRHAITASEENNDIILKHR